MIRITHHASRITHAAVLTRIAARDALLAHGRARDYRFLACACAVVVYNNLGILWSAAGSGHPFLVGGSNLLIWGAILGWATWIEKLTLADLGIRVENFGRSLVWGLGAGVAMAAPAVLFFVFPFILPEPVRFGRYAGVDPGTVPFVLLFLLMVSTTAIFEEFLFRGLIQERGVRWLGAARGIGLSCGLFILWHVVITYQSIQHTNLTAAVIPWPILYGASAVPLGVAGLILSLIRYKTGNIAGCVAAHGLTIFLMQGSLLMMASGTPAGT